MANLAVFPSIQHPTVRYVLVNHDDELWNRTYKSHGDPLGECFGWYDTYGDADTQHTSTLPVVSYPRCADYLMSLSKHLLDSQHYETPQLATILWALEGASKVPSKEKIRFALTVEHKDGKPTYLNMQELKVSRSPSKHYDRRWMKVEPAYDGTVRGALNLLAASVHAQYQVHRYLFERLMTAATVCEIAEYLDPRVYTEGGPVHLSIESPRGSTEAEDLRHGVLALRTAMQMLRTRVELCNITSRHADILDQRAKRDQPAIVADETASL